jgi:hypothetical protein
MGRSVSKAPPGRAPPSGFLFPFKVSLATGDWQIIRMHNV